MRPPPPSAQSDNGTLSGIGEQLASCAIEAADKVDFDTFPTSYLRPPQ